MGRRSREAGYYVEMAAGSVDEHLALCGDDGGDDVCERKMLYAREEM